jgi:hypothetical protein
MHESILHTQKCEMSTSQRSVLCTPFVTFPRRHNVALSPRP